MLISCSKPFLVAVYFSSSPSFVSALQTRCVPRNSAATHHAVRFPEQSCIQHGGVGHLTLKTEGQEAEARFVRSYIDVVMKIHIKDYL